MPPKIAFDMWNQYLPNLQKLMKKGAYSELESVIPYVTAPAWVSFITGKNPGKTSIFEFTKPRINLSEMRPINSKDIKVKTLYELLKIKNKKSILVNLPVSYPPKTDNITITDFLTLGKDFVFPSSLKKEIPELNEYKIMPDAEYMSKDNPELLAKSCREMENIRFKVSKKLFQKKQWDFFFVLFSASDIIQHKAHNLIMQNKLDKNSEILKLFIELDQYLGWFMNNLPKNTNLFLMSDHGFKTYKGAFSINNYFYKKDLIKTKNELNKVTSTISQKQKKELLSKKGNKIKINKILRLILKNKFLFQISWRFYKLMKKYKLINIDIGQYVDPDKSKICFYGGLQSIYINSKNKYKNGLVEKEEYENFRQKIIDELKNLKDPEGNKLFQKVYKNEEIYQGRYLSQSADIYVKFNNYLLQSKLIGSNFFNQKLQSHDIDGIFGAYGPDIKPLGKIKKLKIIDIAPMTLYSMDLAIDTDMDGKIRLDLFKNKKNIKINKPDHFIKDIKI